MWSKLRPYLFEKLLLGPDQPSFYKTKKKISHDCYVGGLVAKMEANAWLSVIAKKGAVVVYPRTIRCQNDTFGMGFFLFLFRPTDPNFSLKNPSNNFFK